MAHHVTAYGSSWCSDCKRAKRFLGDQQVQDTWVDVEQDARHAEVEMMGATAA